MLSAGSTLKSKPEMSVSAAPNATNRQWTEISAARGRLVGSSDASAATPHAASVSPIAPPMMKSTSPSVASWRTRRPRLAPIAARTESSRPRALPRAIVRPATLTHAISNTKATATSTMTRFFWAPAVISSARPAMPIVTVALLSVYVSERRLPMTASSSRADSSRTLSRRRATTRR